MHSIDRQKTRGERNKKQTNELVELAYLCEKKTYLYDIVIFFYIIFSHRHDY